MELSDVKSITMFNMNTGETVMDVSIPKKSETVNSLGKKLQFWEKPTWNLSINSKGLVDYLDVLELGEDVILNVTKDSGQEIKVAGKVAGFNKNKIGTMVINLSQDETAKVIDLEGWTFNGR